MSDAEAPAQVAELAAQTVEFVRRAVGVALEYDSDTLPLLDHYLREVPQDQPRTVELIATTAGAYFGEVVRRAFGGRWDLSSGVPREWRMILPTGIHFAPAGLAAAAILGADLEDLDTTIDAPPRMRPHLDEALARMGQVTAQEYYSLCGRLDTLEHLHEVLVGVAAALRREQGGDDDGDDGEEPPPGTDAN
ncbi:MAG: hypothetical protein R2939_12220 [Kofleriaceae bacterium]